MNLIRRFFKQGDDNEVSSSAVPMTEDRIDMSFRIFWTKICRNWPLDQIQDVQQQVRPITQQADFEKNLIERRYSVPGLVEGETHQMHSGASLLALLQVLDTLERMSNDNQES